MSTRTLMTIAWPAFLVACLLEAAVFAVVDPLEVSGVGERLAWSRQAVYTAAFFLFWGACVLSGSIALWIGQDDADAPS